MGEEEGIWTSGVERRLNACGETKGHEMEHGVPQGVRDLSRPRSLQGLPGPPLGSLKRVKHSIVCLTTHLFKDHIRKSKVEVGS